MLTPQEFFRLWEGDRLDALREEQYTLLEALKFHGVDGQVILMDVRLKRYGRPTMRLFVLPSADVELAA